MRVGAVGATSLYLTFCQPDRRETRMAKNIQIGADVSDDLRNRVLRYAEALHLSESGLVNLLIARELELKRLANLKLFRAAKRPASGPRPRLTGRQNEPSLRINFEHHVKALGIDRADAVVTLAEAELHERWLPKALGLRTESH